MEKELSDRQEQIERFNHTISELEGRLTTTNEEKSSLLEEKSAVEKDLRDEEAQLAALRVEVFKSNLEYLE